MTPTLRRIGQEKCLPDACTLTAAGDPRAQDRISDMFWLCTVPAVFTKLVDKQPIYLEFSKFMPSNRKPVGTVFIWGLAAQAKTQTLSLQPAIQLQPTDTKSGCPSLNTRLQEMGTGLSEVSLEVASGPHTQTNARTGQ